MRTGPAATIWLEVAHSTGTVWIHSVKPTWRKGDKEWNSSCPKHCQVSDAVRFFGIEGKTLEGIEDGSLLEIRLETINIKVGSNER